ncbi:deoxyribonuclease-1 [Patella vulgata]|uniref:deoxyribonuclease-1 n=1 Tax=Patella vulgata TaxID=6465 RepID=UPI0021801772|nr:deoxyribonuclease-1 [Patella vulgata]
MAVLVSIIVFVLTLCQMNQMVNGLKIGSFNIQIFGESKSKKPDVMDIIGKIVVRYDIVLILEIRDSKKKAMPKLMEIIQPRSGDPEYKMEISDRVGRTTSKEQYAFLYRDNLGLKVVESFHYDDGDEKKKEDQFEREPFVVHFKSPKTDVEDFVLIAIHVDPDEAVSEINHLETVLDYVWGRTGVDNIIIMGDLNADCSYVSKRAMKTINLRHRSDLYWPIDDDADTTAGKTNCAYDRFVIRGRSLIKSIIPGSVQIFNYQNEYQLDDKLTLKVSDHYPIEMAIEGITDVGGVEIYQTRKTLVVFCVTLAIVKISMYI